MIPKGFKHSEETKMKMSNFLKGRVFSEEHRRNIGLAQIGRIPWNKGLPMSDEAKKNLSNSHKGKVLSEEHKRKIGEGGKGRKFTEEHKRRISEAQKGEKSNNWQGGITKLQAHIRHCFKYRQWRSDIFTINDFTCQECEQKGGRLHADHIEPFSVILARNHIETFEQAIECEELFSLNNGRTQCEDCHKNTDTYLS